MTLMSSAIFAIEQVGVDRHRSVTDVHEKQFIGQREKVLAVAFEYRNHVLIQQSATVEFGNLLCSHVLAHVQLGCDFIRTGQGIFVAVDMQIAEIGEDGKPLGFQFPFPDTIWNWEAASLWIRLIEKETHLYDHTFPLRSKAPKGMKPKYLRRNLSKFVRLYLRKQAHYRAREGE